MKSDYLIIPPPTHLQSIIRHYWLLDLSSTDPLKEYLFAYPYMNWVFTSGVPYQVSDPLGGRFQVNESCIIGLRTNPVEYLHPRGNIAFGVTFQFGSGVHFVKEEPQQFQNKIASFENVLPQHKWVDDYFYEKTVSEFVDVLNTRIFNRVSVPSTPSFATWKMFLFELDHNNAYNLSIQDISKKLGVSQRHLQRICLQYSGLAPKQIQSMLRCRKAVQHIQKTGNLTDCYLFDYCDQSHFIKEVRKWSGVVPSALLK